MISQFYWFCLKRLEREHFCRVFNIFEVFKRGKLKRKCDYLPSARLYRISDESGSVYFPRKLRILRYLDGVFAKSEKLFLDYTGGLVAIRPGDIVIDCGANIGEFSIFCLNQKAEVYAFEPDPLELAALRANLKSTSTVSDLALWRDSNGVQFYLCNDSGDSGAFSSHSATDYVRVGTTTIDKVVQDIHSCKPGCQIRLLKLEAEGAEPEIVQGALSALRHIKYIAADLGPERGPGSENTVPLVVNTLLSNGFKILHYLPSRSIFLFENTRL